MWIVRIACFIGTLFLVSGCSVDDGRPLKIATTLWPGYEPLYLAQYISAYRERVDIIQLASATEVMRALRHGNIDGAALTLDEVVTLMAEGTELVVLLALDFSRGGDAVLTFPNDNEVLALKGRRVGVENTALGAMVLSEALINAGLTVQDIEIVNVSVDRHVEALISGKVDVVVTFEPFKTRLLKEGARVVFDTTQAPELVVDVLVVKKSVFDGQGDDVKALLAGYISARQYMVSNRSESLNFMSKRLQLDVAQTRKVFEGMHLPSLQENIEWFEGDSSAYEKSIELTARVLQDRNLLDSDFKLVVYGNADMLREAAH